jgi:hypothetical protein
MNKSARYPVLKTGVASAAGTAALPYFIPSGILPSPVVRAYSALRFRDRLLANTRRSIMQAILFAVALPILCSAAPAQTPGPALSAWTIGKPIVTYWDGPGVFDDRVANQAVKGGFNVVWVHSLAELNLAQKYGLRGLFYGPQDEKTISQICNHPALFAYYVADEPSASAFASLGVTGSRLRSLDPNHPAYVSLLPTYATSAMLGTPDYATYLNDFVRSVQPSLLSYDHYQFYTGNDSPDYFKNLAIISHTAKQAKIPFMNIVQGCAWEAGWRVPNAGELRYLANTTLAYGGQAISYFNYMTYGRPDSGGGIQNSDGSPTSVATALQSINPQFVAIAQELQTMKHIGAYHLGDLPPGYDTTDGSSPMRLPDNSTFTISGVASSDYQTNQPVRGAVLGLFGPNDQLADATCTLVVNLDYANPLNTRVTGPGNLSVFDPATGRWSEQGHSWCDASLPPGGSVLVGLTTAFPHAEPPKP